VEFNKIMASEHSFGKLMILRYIRRMTDSRQLFTDFYQISMAYASWKNRRMELPAVFTLYFRSNPFRGGYCVAAGLETALAHLETFGFQQDDLTYLSALRNEKDRPLFEQGFLDYLGQSKLECDVLAVPEGNVVFPHEPILRVQGPLWQCQYVESALLNTINFQTLIATKAARMAQAAHGEDLIEFGLRRAQGFDGALSASRAAYIGGVNATSNVLAGKRFGIPVRGTHAHSWIMSFDSELEAFRAYARALPDSALLLVDTYETMSGIDNAIQVAKELAQKQHRLAGIRLDSGDFAYLSIQARKKLDDAGFPDAKIIASNELDESLIQSLHWQDSKIDTWGIGTKLVTAEDQPSLSGVFKLTAVKEDGEWKYKVKVSNQAIKTSNPGIHRLLRLFNEEGQMEGDLIYDEGEDVSSVDRMVDPVLASRTKKIQKNWSSRELLEPVLRRGQRLHPALPLKDLRTRAIEALKTLHPGCRRLENPHEYPVGLSPRLARIKEELIQQYKGGRA
jgi:nicotinate phosphoribosyltransferase